ncbi:rifin [Plasmodium falciparum RAJ116]|uniref:Rifin n=1 Tax=Plasmodium falciparum RAJ116 TaxID=580058 RepID=A0A0L0CSA5_PLAFA|nr:rifin [Plasmodium falciparum RAJ116]
MKLHYYKILLFSLSLIILVISSSNAHNKNKAYITTHTPTPTSRVLSECDLYMSNYDKDADMKSVKENFDRQTSQRFEEYEEHMQEKRRKCKEQCDKDIQQIILKDKMDKSLAEKVEIGCLRCGCGLGGVAASVGLFGGLGIYSWKSVALAKAIAEGAAKGAEVGEAVRIAAAIDAVIKGIETKFGVSTNGVLGLKSLFTANTYNDVTKIANAVYEEYSATCISRVGGSVLAPVPVVRKPICTLVWQNSQGNVHSGSANALIKKAVKTIVSDAPKTAETAVETATKEAIKASTDAVESTYAICQTAIIASVVALLIIVLVMIIIYLVLRYRRKKKMKKKAQYTKLLNE